MVDGINPNLAKGETTKVVPQRNLALNYHPARDSSESRQPGQFLLERISPRSSEVQKPKFARSVGLVLLGFLTGSQFGDWGTSVVSVGDWISLVNKGKSTQALAREEQVNGRNLVGIFLMKVQI